MRSEYSFSSLLVALILVSCDTTPVTELIFQFPEDNNDSIFITSLSNAIDSSIQYSNVHVTQFANNSACHQSSSSYQDFLILVTQGRRIFYIYNLNNKEMVCSLSVGSESSVSSFDVDLYHSNQSSFGVDLYDSHDMFPLFYISQRAKDDSRCFVECYRIVPIQDNSISEISSFKIQLVQTIYFPPMSKYNSLGNVNCVIDHDNRLMYTYSRNNSKKDRNYGICKISCFNIPNIFLPVVYLENSDIVDSFFINCSAINMQGGCIWDGKLYIGQGYKAVGYIYMNVIDLSKRELLYRVDLLSNGIEWEPEGCFVYDNRIMVSSNDNNIWSLDFDE